MVVVEVVVVVVDFFLFFLSDALENKLLCCNKNVQRLLHLAFDRRIALGRSKTRFANACDEKIFLQSCRRRLRSRLNHRKPVF